MTELAVRETTNGHVPREWIDVMAPAVELARQIVGTEFVPRGLRGNAAGIVAAIMYGDELGLGPMQALAKIAVIDGKPSLSAEAQRALILRAGHELRVDESSTTRVTVSGRRSGSDSWSSVTWTLDDAKRANLAGKPNWRTYPRQMLTARATAELARLLFADVIGGMIATEEIDDGDPLGDEPVGDVKPVAKTTTTRRRRKDKTPEAEVEQPAGGEADGERGSSGTELPPIPGEPLDVPATEPDDASTVVVEPDAGETVAPDDAGTAASDESASGSSPPDADPAADELPLDEDKPSEAQLNALNVLVVKLREAEVEVDGERRPVMSMEQLWAAVARRRTYPVDDMIELLGGRYVGEGEDAERLHWPELRDSLTKSEASHLIDVLSERATKWGVA